MAYSDLLVVYPSELCVRDTVRQDILLIGFKLTVQYPLITPRQPNMCDTNKESSKTTQYV